MWRRIFCVGDILCGREHCVEGVTCWEVWRFRATVGVAVPRATVSDVFIIYHLDYEKCNHYSSASTQKSRKNCKRIKSRPI